MTPFEDFSRRGIDEFRAKNYSAARELFERALEIRPKSPNAQAYHAMCVYELGDKREALVEAELAVHYGHDSPFAHSTYGWMLLYSGRAQEAQHQIELALDMDRDSLNNFVLLGRCFVAQDMWSQARECATKALAFDSSSLKAQGLMGKIEEYWDQQLILSLKQLSSDPRSQEPANFVLSTVRGKKAQEMLFRLALMVMKVPQGRIVALILLGASVWIAGSNDLIAMKWAGALAACLWALLFLAGPLFISLLLVQRKGPFGKRRAWITAGLACDSLVVGSVIAAATRSLETAVVLLAIATAIRLASLYYVRPLPGRGSSPDDGS